MSTKSSRVTPAAKSAQAAKKVAAPAKRPSTSVGSRVARLEKQITELQTVVKGLLTQAAMAEIQPQIQARMQAEVQAKVATAFTVAEE